MIVQPHQPTGAMWVKIDRTLSPTLQFGYTVILQHNPGS